MPTLTEPPGIESVDFARIQGRLNRLLVPSERNATVSVYGIPGAGKSHLIRHGLLPALGANSRVLVIDVKNTGPWRTFGEIVTEVPEQFGSDGSWHVRLVCSRNQAKRLRQIKRALEIVAREGHCLLVVDESQIMTDESSLRDTFSTLLTQGRGLGISVIHGRQITANSRPALRSTGAVHFIGQISGLEEARALSKALGFDIRKRETSWLAPELVATKPREFVYMDRLEGEPMLARTSLTKGVRL